MKIMITGGLGHIGSKLIQNISEEHEVVVFDDLSTQRFCSLFNINRKIQFIQRSVNEIESKDLLGFDAVIHLAAITNASESFNNKDLIEKINLDHTSYFIDLCDEAGCKFIFPSSTSVYGKSAEIVDESSDDFLNPQSPYAETKIKIEEKLKSYSSKYVILRFGTVFGKSSGMRFHTAINKFCYEASLGLPLTVWEDNFNQYRPYLDISDAISSINFCLDSEDVWNETYNVLTGNYKLSEIVGIIREFKNVSLNMVKTPLLNQHSYNVSDQKIRKMGFIPNGDIRKAIKESLDLFKNINC